MHDVRIVAKTMEELQTLFLVQTVYKPKDVNVSSEQEFVMNKRFADGLMLMREKFGDVEELRQTERLAAIYF
jgi:hypothetical protein